MCKSEICILEQPARSCYTHDEMTLSSPTLVICSKQGIRQFPKELPSSVEIVRFDHNYIVSLSRDMFSSFHDNMKELSLEINRISFIEDNTFDKARYLQIINLSGNQLKHIGPETFSRLYDLRTLQLDRNLITQIDPETFSDLHQLNMLTLHGNQLTELHNGTLQDIDLAPHLSNLTLHDNPWSCQCDNATSKNWIHSHIGATVYVDRIKCNGSVPLVSIPDEQLLCYEDVRRILVDNSHDSVLPGPLGLCADPPFSWSS